MCQKLGAIRKVRNCLGQPLALRPYKSLVLPQYDYCSTIYMCANKETLHRLQLVQNIGSRTILKAGKHTPTTEMHKHLGLLPLDECRASYVTRTYFRKHCRAYRNILPLPQVWVVGILEPLVGIACLCQSSKLRKVNMHSYTVVPITGTNWTTI